MPGQLGGLVVSLGLDAVDYTQGLTKAERDAAQFSQNITSAFTKIGATLGALGIGAAVFDATKEIISSASALQDLAGVTGSSVESLSKLSNQAKISGANFNQLQTALEKLSVVIGGVGPPAERAQKAMALLGVTATDPATALNEIAVAFSKYEDGARKAAFAQAIFGKSGPEFLKVLKDIAETQDVAATVTAKQAEEANNLEKQLRTLSVEATTFSNALLSHVVPALNETISDFRDATKVAGGFLGALLLFATQSPFDSLGESIKKTNAEIAALQARKNDGFSLTNWLGITDADLKLAKMNSELQKLQVRREAMALISADNADARDLRLKKQLPELPPTGGGGRAAADRISDAERLLKSLEKQLEATQNLSAEEKVLNEIRAAGFTGLTPEREARILGAAREIDQIKALAEARKAHEKAVAEDERAIQKANDERERAIKSAQASLASAEAGNQSIREEIAILVGGEDARKAIERHHIDMAIAIKDQLLGQRELNGASKEETDIIRAEISTLEKRKELLDSRDFAEAMKRDAEQLQQFKNIFADTFADAFASFIDGSKSASDAFKAFAKSVEQQITRLAAQNIANAIFGGTTGGGFDFSKIIQALIGGISGGGSFGGAGGGGGFGTLSTGTDFWRGGPAVVGESGPEVVNLPRGATVTSNQDSQKLFGPSMNFVINVLPGASTKTAQQAAVMTGIQVQRAIARNT